MLNIYVNHAVPNTGLSSLYDMESIGDRIRELRKTQHLSQEDLAEIAGVTKSAVSQWETGAVDNIKPPALLAIMRHFGVTLEYLVEGAGAKRRTG